MSDEKTYGVYFEMESDEDIHAFAAASKKKQDALIRVKAWPDENDRSEMGLKKIGQAIRHCDEFAENDFYLPIVNWLLTHQQYKLVDMISFERGHFMEILFEEKDGQEAFLKAFPKWTSKDLVAWMKGLPIGHSKYDLPDDD